MQNKRKIPKAYRNRMVDKAEALHYNLTAFLRHYMGSDWRYYKYGYLKMGDRSIKINFNRSEYDVTCYHYKHVPGNERWIGDEFCLIPDYCDGFLLDMRFIKSDHEHYTLLACKTPHPYEEMLTTSEMKDFENLIDELDRQLPTLEYDAEKTHVPSNLNLKSEYVRNKLIYDEEVENLKDGEVFVPAVKAAVDWWVENMGGNCFRGKSGMTGMAGAFYLWAQQKQFMSTNPTQEDFDKFRVLLGNLITERISQGYDIRLTTDWGPEGILSDVIVEAGINTARAPINTSMYIDVERVCVNGTEIYKQEHDIYKYLEKEEEKEMELKRKNNEGEK